MNHRIVISLTLIMIFVSASSPGVSWAITTDTVIDDLTYLGEDLAVFDGPDGEPTTLTILDGAEFGYDGFALWTYESSVGYMWGGIIHGYFMLEDHSEGNVYGGVIYGDLNAFETSVVHVHGGFLRGRYEVEDRAVIHIYGSRLRIDFSTERLTGQLEDGTVLDHWIYTDGTGQFVLHNIPEPSTASLLALGLVGIAAMRRQRAN